MSIFLPKHLSTSWVRSLSRCVSWIASIAILYVFRVRFMVDHFSIPLSWLDGAAKPFTFRVAMFMFALCRVVFFFFFFGIHFRAPESTEPYVARSPT
jgi:hypothetical protein